MDNRISTESILDDIFNNDPLGLLDIKKRSTGIKNADDRLIASFEEINDFVEKNDRIPKTTSSNVSEKQLYFRLKSLCDELDKVILLKKYDVHGLLPRLDLSQVADKKSKYTPPPKKEYNSFDDILSDDSLDILGGDDEGLFEYKHIPKESERAASDFVARRKACKNFEDYEADFKRVQKDLSQGKRKLLEFNQKDLVENRYFINNGMLLKLVNVKWDRSIQEFNSGVHIRPDGRTKTIFENGTESDLMYQSLYKALHFNGHTVSENKDDISGMFDPSIPNIEPDVAKVTPKVIVNLDKIGISPSPSMENEDIVKDDVENGFIYVLTSKSKDQSISSIPNLHKIGFSTTSVEERVKNAEHEPTYLMAPVHIKATYDCYNMSPHKFEQLIHNFFGKTCLNVDVFDSKAERHSPREWFIVPFDVIDQVIDLILSGKIIGYKYDVENMMIVRK